MSAAKLAVLNPPPVKYRIAGVGISATSYSEVTDICERWIAERREGASLPRARYICVTSVHGVITARDAPEVSTILNEADIATPDGMPLVWALRSFGFKDQERVYGPNLMLHLCESAARHGFRVFLYGGRPECLNDLQHALLEKFPHIQIAGAYSPPFRSLSVGEVAQVRKTIQDSGAELIFVGISTPKQEQWMYANCGAFPGAVMVGVGAAFDFHAGRIRQAPPLLQRLGLEWLFRLVMEPGRLWRRYLLITPRFLPLWAMQIFRDRRDALMGVADPH